MATILKLVEVKRTVFTVTNKAGDVKQYVIDCEKTGSGSVLYQDPNITAVFYKEGTDTAMAIQTAMDTFKAVPTPANRSNIADKVNIAKGWLDDYSGQVEVIANNPANSNTPEEVSTNIKYSFLTPQKLIAEKKGIPETPKIAGLYVGSGLIDVEILNGETYQPNQTTFIVAEASTKAIILLKNGALTVTMASPGDVVVKAASKKGKFTHFTGLKPAVDYAIYAYGQNGKTQVSLLSQPIIVKA